MRASRDGAAGQTFEQLGIAGGVLEEGNQTLGGTEGRRAGLEEAAPEALNDRGLLFRIEELLPARPRGGDIHRRKETPLGEATVQAHLPVAGALELLKDKVVQTTAGLDQGGGEQRQTTAA